MEIRLTDWGVANNFGDYIEVNRHLQTENPKLYQTIINHELDHTKKTGLNTTDFLLDIGETRVNNWELFRFMIRHPKALLQLVPLYRKDKVWIYDINMILSWTVVLSCFGIAYLLFK